MRLPKATHILWLSLAASLWLGAGAAFAQSPAAGTGAGKGDTGPPLRPGPATIEGTVRLPDGTPVSADTDIALYALYPDGTPGVDTAKPDANGSFRFENLANDTGIVYLVGARYRGVPYGDRVTFAAGETLARAEIEVKEPTSDASTLRTREVVLELQWVGGDLAVLEAHRLYNGGGRAILVPEAERARTAPPFEARLPEGATDFGAAAGTLGDGFENENGRIRFWGPIYDGDQELRFQYRLPADSELFEIAKRFPREASRVLLMVPEGSLGIGSTQLAPIAPIEVDGARYSAFEARKVAAGTRLRFEVSLPETTRDPSALALGRADLWMELDDTALIVSADLRVTVAGNARVAGSATEPLLRLPLPEGAELVGVGEDSRRLGLFGLDESVALAGPLPPGESRLTYRYRVPLQGRPAVSLDLRFPRTVPSLNVLIADSGVSVGSDRLHRLRPFQSGTRIYLHREAFEVTADEVVTLRLEPLDREPGSRVAALSAVFLGAALCIWFVVAPLRPQPDAVVGDEESGEIARQRQAVIETIRDLDHDYETGKIEEGDYQGMRSELRARAIALLKEEEQGPAAKIAAVDAPPKSAQGKAAAGFCPHCGEAANVGWKFCAECGGALPQRSPASATPPASAGSDASG